MKIYISCFNKKPHLIATYWYESTYVPSVGDTVKIPPSGISQLGKNMKNRDMIKGWHGVEVRVIERKCQFDHRSGDECWMLVCIIQDTWFK